MGVAAMGKVLGRPAPRLRSYTDYKVHNEFIKVQRMTSDLYNYFLALRASPV